MRGLGTAVVAGMFALTLIVAPSQATASGAADPNPPLRVPQAQLAAAVWCTPDIASSPQVPVVLVHGSGGTASEAWAYSYAPALINRGHPICTFDLPAYGTADVQVNVEYVVHAIRYAHALAGRPVSVIGLSKGAFESVMATRIWSDLAAKVDDVIGLAGVYDRGSQKVDDVCDSQGGCVPALHQISTGSSLLAALRRWSLPAAGPSFTLIGTLEDKTVTPQPVASLQAGAHSVFVEDVCPGRGELFPLSHGMLVGDAVAHDLAFDALTHPGPADVTRVDPLACELQYYADFDEQAYRDNLPTDRTFAKTATPPRVRCYLYIACADAIDRGRLIARPSVRVWHRKVVFRATIIRTGTIELRLAGKRVVKAVRPGNLTLRIARPQTPKPRTKMLQIRSYRAPYTAWAPEHSVRLRSRITR